jgi:hypothetical protein
MKLENWLNICLEKARYIKNPSLILESMKVSKQEEIHVNNMSEALTERYLSTNNEREYFQWMTEQTDGYNPYSRTNLWARIYGYA